MSRGVVGDEVVDGSGSQEGNVLRAYREFEMHLVSAEESLKGFNCGIFKSSS